METKNADGSYSLSRSSRLGLITTAVLVAAAQGAIAWLGTLDLSTLPGYAVAVVTVAVSTAVGALTAYVAKNRK